MRARQKISRAGVELIKSFEGLRQAAARLPDGRWTLGYGHTFSAREGARVTSEDADALLRFDLLPIADSINNLVLVPLNQNQFDALVSFCFNIGAENFAASTVLQRINEGRIAEAALAMDSWRSAEFNGQTYVLAPLIRRRAAEKNLFLTPDEISHQAAMLGRPVEDATVGEPPQAQPVPPPVAISEAVAFHNPYATLPPVARQVIDLGQYAPASEVTPAEPSMSAEVQAAIARAQDEQRQREQSAREEARVQELHRLEAARIEAEKLERERLEQARLEQARLEQASLEQASLEQASLEQASLEQASLEQERLQAFIREQERLERERAEQANLEQIRLEQIRLAQEKQEREQAERARQEAARQAAPPQPTPLQAAPVEDEAEKTRKAEAAAALMRLYSPYGGGVLGRPLVRPAPPPQPAPSAPEVSEPQAFTNHSVISPSSAETTSFELAARPEDLSSATKSVPEAALPPVDAPSVVDFTPSGPVANMPPPVITALNPYASAPAREAVIEVPRPAPLNMAAPSNAPLANAPLMAAGNGLNWRDQLQRPLPQDYQAPPPEQTSFLHTGAASHFQTSAYEESYGDDNEAWMMNGDRIALSSEDSEEEGTNWWQKVVSTVWWILISGIGFGCLGVATGAWWQATHDQTVIRSGFVDTYTLVSIVTAALGILFVSISVWLIMKRLGGLKD